MVKFISKIPGSKIILFQEQAIVGTVNRALINPADGGFVGLAVQALQTKQEMYIPLSEIKGFGQGLVIVEELKSLSDADEVVKIQVILDNEPNIIGSLVVTESGRRLGRVQDATVDLRLAVLKKLYVTPPYLKGVFGDQLIIDAARIIEIEKNKITVRDNTIKVEEGVALQAQIPASE